jgi:periplasmic divalent cation tolerance protein
MKRALIVFSTFANAETARGAAHTLVEERLAACANVVPEIDSIYRWQGKIESNREVLVIFKTTRERYPAFEERLRSLHPYEVPEIVALEPTCGLQAYIDWIAESVE